MDVIVHLILETIFRIGLLLGLYILHQGIKVKVLTHGDSFLILILKGFYNSLNHSHDRTSQAGWSLGGIIQIRENGIVVTFLDIIIDDHAPDSTGIILKRDIQREN